MANKKKLLLLDLDDTVLSFLDNMLRYINLKHDMRVTIDDIVARVPDAMLNDIIEESLWNEEFQNWENAGGYATQKSFDGVRTSMENFLKAGWDIQFVTARPSCFARETEFAFIMNKLPCRDKIHYAPRGKRNILAKLQGDIFLDDSIDNLEAALKAGMKLEQLYLITQPWNIKDTKFQRVGSLMQLERIVLGNDKKGS